MRIAIIGGGAAGLLAAILIRRARPDITPGVFEQNTSDATFGDMQEPAYRAACETVFAEALGGAALVPNNSIWRQFPVLTCERYHAGTRVLVGDALHAAHFSIGSGTRLALEDVLALIKALKAAQWDVGAALPAYQAARQPVLEKITTAAARSAAWYEGFERQMALDPWAFALSYIRRTGRLNAARLAKMAPRFAAELEAARRGDAMTYPTVDDLAAQVGFAVADDYNASRLLWDNLPPQAVRLAIYCDERIWTYAELTARAAQFGAALLARGAMPGHRVLMFMDDEPAYPAEMGAMRAGLVPVLLNTLSPPDLAQFCIEDSGAVAAVNSPSYAATFAADAPLGTSCAGVICSDDPLVSMPDTLTEATTNPGDPAFWMYSSGSTGKPKGVVH